MFCLALATLLAGCGEIAVFMAPKKLPSATRTQAAQAADEVFWSTLHAGNYNGIDAALDRLTAAYLESPSDGVTAARIGWLHAWKLAERSRLARVPASITDHAILARRFFDEASRLDPAEARVRGFLGSMLLSEGAIHQDEKLTREGYFTLLKSIDEWPEFNLFTAGYVLSDQPRDSDRFREAVAWQWDTLDRCAGRKIDRSTADYSGVKPTGPADGPTRVCWNSAIAPHNFEGFFLNMGDMLVKSGDWRTAQKVYANARLSPDFGRWRFAPVLEKRIRDAEANGARFAEKGQRALPPEDRMMLNSPFACMACHQT